MSDVNKEQASITVYCTQFCPYCVRAKSLLNHKGVRYTSIDIDAEPNRYNEMLEKSGGVTSVPQIFIDDFHVGGCDELYDTEAQGKLDGLLFKS